MFTDISSFWDEIARRFRCVYENVVFIEIN